MARLPQTLNPPRSSSMARTFSSAPSSGSLLLQAPALKSESRAPLNHSAPEDISVTKASLLLVFLFAAAAVAQQPAPLSALARMPVKEITIFKDGHAFLLHEGVMPTDAAGNVIMDYLPSPVLGTFWPYSSNKDLKLIGVTASQRKVLVEETAITLAELLEANTGVEAIISEKPLGKDERIYAGTILGIPTRSPEELAATGLPNIGEQLPEKGNVILLRTAEGIKVMPIENIKDVTFKSPHRAKLSNEQFRNALTLKLDWAGRKPEKTADVGLVYLQKGVRWIPSYKVTIDGAGSAAIKLQATLLNELTDLSDVTANLVIGVPTFAFRESTDPIALQKKAAELSQYFQNDRAQMMSNGIATQAARMGEYRAAPSESPADLGPSLPESKASEDLFVFSVRHITLKKGERMAMPIAEYSLPYKDVFTLDLPFAPPPEVRSNLNNEQQAEMARLFAEPKVTHKIRLTNKGAYPLTTAPALIIRDNRVLAQGMTTYTSAGASTDLEITKAVDVQVAKSENETQRTPNAVRLQGNDYARVDLAGKITLTNHKSQPIELEITRHVLGNVQTADHDGAIVKINSFEDDRDTTGGAYPPWWGWYGWPSWWRQFNGVGRITWKINLEAGKSVELGYTWHYFWR